MKRIFASAIVLLTVAIAYAGKVESDTKITARQKFDQKYEKMFGQKPSDKIWALGLNPTCSSTSCYGGSKCNAGGGGRCSVKT